MTDMDRERRRPTAFHFIFKVPESIKSWRHQRISHPYTTQPSVSLPHRCHQCHSPEEPNRPYFSSSLESSWMRPGNAESVNWRAVSRHGFAQEISPDTSTDDNTHWTKPRPIGTVSDASGESFHSGHSASLSSTMTMSSLTGQLPETAEKDPNERGRFTHLGSLITGNLQGKSVLISLDTMAQVSIMRKDIFDKLGLPLDHFSGALVPLQTRSAETPIRPIGLVRHVDWRFARGSQTYTTDFLVVDTDQYDVLIGEPEIKRYHLLQLGPDIPNAVVRQL
ncbi:hypothetical protein ASPBRDRAFT_45488 [Aspergillus brasiliensis CBS 101740]|uniref:Uncharacterized protein n=1 Tax=Aspergillus brasiliensis (strain CBS 101740 / IMI 381727 / IBT 21946) TaxID=767769 RepID=A0A1L9UEV7_ASPBC|nr:hypothetical protein ASPBRDRAFT_45488 [Aspergillus brasiliensis CBS 101740]